MEKVAHKEAKRMLSRREAFKSTSLALAGLAVATSTKGSFAKETKKAHKLAMAIDLRKCTGCQSCQVACKAEFDVPLGKHRSQVDSWDVGKYPKVRRMFLPKQCNHCDNPVCVAVCPVEPVKATSKRDDGVVVVDETLCIGCGNCVEECPYKARFINSGDKAEKCDYCIARVEGGVVPSCVNTCPAEAKVFGDLNDPSSDVAKLVKSNIVKTIPASPDTKPQIFYILASGQTSLTK